MTRFFSRETFRRRLPWLVAAALLLAAAGWWGRGRFQPANPLLESPALLLEAVQAKTLYFNGPAYDWLRSRRPDLLPPEDRAGPTDRTRAFAQAVLAPPLFRQADREQRFDALLFLGDPSQYRPLLEHLVTTKDWSLSYVDHWGMVFRRAGAPVWKLADLEPVRARFAGASARARAMFLAQTGLKLVTARELTAAQQVLDEAAQLDARLPDVWNGRAVLHLQRREYAEAIAEADRALALDKDHLPSLATKTLLLYGTRQFSDAYALSSQLIARLPEDPNLLFYHARIAHEAHAYSAEVEALKKLIARAEDENRPLSGYQLYLGQAYVALGDGPGAIDAFMNVLNDPDLPQDQRDFARENIARIKKRTGL
jgi:tetratricopeptide (TPR) repeat protein